MVRAKSGSRGSRLGHGPSRMIIVRRFMHSARPYDPDVKMISGLPSALTWPARAVRYHGRARTSEFHRSNCTATHTMMSFVLPELVRWHPETSRARPGYLPLVRAGVIVLQPFLTGIDLDLAIAVCVSQTKK